MRNSIAVFSILLILGACKKAETPAPQTASVESSTNNTATVAATQTVSTTAPAPAAASPTAGAIASSDGERSGARIEITELKRTSGGTVNLKFVITNNGTEPFGFAPQYLGDSQVSNDHYRDVSGIHLLDPVNKKKYFVVTDAEKRCVCSKDVADVHPGAKVNLWAKFPAPPPEVTKVTIEIPHFAPIDDAPIAQ